MSLRTRIAFSAAAAVLAAIALFAAGAYWLISERAYDRLDSSLAETADKVAEELEAPDLGGRDFAEPPTPGAPARPAPGVGGSAKSRPTSAGASSSSATWAAVSESELSRRS